MSWPEVKLSRAKLQAALADLNDPNRNILHAVYDHLDMLIAASSALLRVIEPASDEEVSALFSDVPSNHPPTLYKYGLREGHRAAEARARRLAHWQDEP